MGDIVRRGLMQERSSGIVSDTFAEICNGAVTSYESSALTRVPGNVLRSNVHNIITSMKIPNCQDIGGYGLGGTRIPVIALPEFLGNIYSDGFAFSGNTALRIVDIGTKVNRIYGNFFNGATNLDTLIIRKTTIPTLQSVNAFNNTKFKSGGAGGTIYIPEELYDHLGDDSSLDYQKVTNWATVYGYGTITWAKIEGSEYENYYADGTPIV